MSRSRCSESFVWHTFDVVGSDSPVNWAWERIQARVTEVLGSDWRAEVQHVGHCSNRSDDGCRLMPCPPIFDRGDAGYRVLIPAPRIEAYGDSPLVAFENVERALS